MSVEITAAIIGAAAAIVAAIIPVILLRKRKNPKLRRGTSSTEENVQLLFKEIISSKSSQAKEIEAQLFEIFKKEPSLILKYANAYEPSSREAVAVVAGKLLHQGIRSKEIEALLFKLRRDPNKWVQSKAQHAIDLLKISDQSNN